MNITTEISSWFIPLCLLAGGLYAFALYFRDRRSEFTRTLRWFMAAARFVAVSLIAFLLLSPLIRTTVRTVEKPVIIMAQDNSQSLLINKDSAWYSKQYPAEINKLYNELAQDFEVRAYSFGDNVAEGLLTDFIGKQTDMSAMIDEVMVRYANRNVGAMIIASDGIYNKGNSPLYAASKIAFPVYTIALGDTAIQKDIILSRVNYNKVCYLGNSFPVEAVLQASKCRGARTTMTVSLNEQALFTKTIDINDEFQVETVSLTLDATRSGIQRYRVRFSPVEGEISTANNVQDIFVNVLDARQKILIIGGAPHPDLAAIRSSIESNQNYEVDVAFKNEFAGNFDSYNLIILHQVPYKNDIIGGQFASLSDPKVPLLYILGAQSDLARFNQMQTGLDIKQGVAKFDEAQPVINNEFALFTISDEIRRALQEIPPLYCPYGEYKTLTSATPLFYQKIGKVATPRPLILFNAYGDVKTGVVCGEGLWRWKLNNYLQNGNHRMFDELISKMVQYLSVKADKSFFRVKCKNNFFENEQVQFDAEVYNESYELINEPEVTMVITDENNKKYNFTFAKTTAAYHLNIGMFGVGEYRYTAKVKVGNKLMQESGVFTVSAVNAESINLIADHGLMNAIAVRHKGSMVYPGSMNELVKMLKERDDIRSVAYSQKKYSDVINLVVVLIIILALISAEWFLRKRSGTY